MDELDRTLLAALRADARTPVAELARQAGVARATVYERLKRLEAEGVLLGTTARLDPAALGRPLRAFILVGWQAERHDDQREVARRLAAVPGVERVHIVTGKLDFLVELHARDMEEVGRVIIERMRAIPGVGDTETLLGFWSFEGPGVPLDAAHEAAAERPG